MNTINIIKGEAIEEMNKLHDNSVDMILCDLPYGMTQNKWDSIIPLEEMWVQFKRVIKENGCVALTAMQPFTSNLIMSNPEWFRYEWIWKKDNGTGHLNAKKQPLRNHENIIIFYKKQTKYNPQMMPGKKYQVSKGTNSNNYGSQTNCVTNDYKGKRYPHTIIAFKRDKDKLHPTQKPINLFLYLIETYTDEGDTVLDCCIGSGTTAVACKRTNRNCIGIEMDKKYVDITNQRLKDEC